MNSSKKAVTFVDLSGSTTIFEEIGDEKATELVRKITHDIATHLSERGGQVVKFLGDGVMILFDTAEQAINACLLLGEVLIEAGELVPQNLLGTDRISVRVGVDYGSIVEFENDVYGDVVNVASRILALAEPHELMMTVAVYEHLSVQLRENCRRLGRVFLRGKSQPQEIYGIKLGNGDDVTAGTTQYSQETVMASVKKAPWAEIISDTYIALIYNDQEYRFSKEQLPITIGRSLESDLIVQDARVSRAHIRLDWFAGQFFLTDTSINGTMVQYGGAEPGNPSPVSIRRQRCTLVKNGFIILGLASRDMLINENSQIPPTLKYKIEEK